MLMIHGIPRFYISILSVLFSLISGNLVNKLVFSLQITSPELPGRKGNIETDKRAISLQISEIFFPEQGKQSRSSTDG